MIDKKALNELIELSELEIIKNAPLKEYTTWKIGGPADYLVIAKTDEELIKICKYCIKNNIKFTILGKGSNVLISDEGLRGLVIINDYKNIKIQEPYKIDKVTIDNKIKARVEDNEFNYEEKPSERVKVNISSGTILTYAINNLIDNGVTGLQWFAGIPGTIGGALFNNIHGGSHFFSEFVDSAKILNEQGRIVNLKKEDMDLGYDQSIFHKMKFIIIEVTLILNIGDKEKALKSAMAWTKKKIENQAFINTAGCCFKNISDEEKQKFNLPANSWGYIIDNILKLKGTRIGGAQISNKHAAFIENVAGASATDILDLLDLIYEKSEALLHLRPKAEIFFLGFNEDTIQKYL